MAAFPSCVGPGQAPCSVHAGHRNSKKNRFSADAAENLKIRQQLLAKRAAGSACVRVFASTLCSFASLARSTTSTAQIPGRGG